MPIGAKAVISAALGAFRTFVVATDASPFDRKVGGWAGERCARFWIHAGTARPQRGCRSLREPRAVAGSMAGEARCAARARPLGHVIEHRR